MKRKVLIVIMFFILLFSLSYVNAQEISTDNGGLDDSIALSQSDELLGSGIKLNGVGDSLSDLKNVVQSADIIALNHNYTYTTGDPTDGIIANGTKMIIGNNITIDGKNQARLFVFNSSSLYISGINFINFKTDANGAAIYANGSSAVITDCTFENCEAKNGGALYYDGISLLIVNTTFKNNKAIEDGAGAYVTAYSTIVANSTFTDCNSKNGGGLYWKKTEKSISNSQINLDPISAGGSIAIGSGTTAIGTNSISLGAGTYLYGNYSIAWGEELFKINNNQYTIFVGSISSNSSLIGSCSILKGQNSKIANTIASSVVGNNYDLSDVKGITAYNGLIANEGLIIVNSKFNTNKVSSRGAGVYAESNSTLLVRNSTFENSHADEGAAIYGINLTKVDIEKSSFKDNIASRGGAVYLTKSFNIRFVNSEFIQNAAIHNYGGAIQVVGSNISIINSEFHNNSAYSGGAVYVEDSSVFTVRNSTFEDNDARNNVGGAIALAGEANIYNSTFNRNTARFRGGAIHSSDLTSKVTRVYNSSFDRNGITGWGGNYYGGAIFYADLIENCNFTNNYGYSGGAIYQWHNHNYRLTIRNSTFINNTAVGTGGAVYAHYGGNMYDCIFYNNVAGNDGGAIGGWNQIPYQCLFVNNSAKVGGAVGGETARSYNSLYINNSASELGGAIYGFNLNIQNNLIINSTSAKNGGAIGTIEYMDSDVYWSSSTFRNNTIINSTATKNGGAVYLSNPESIKVFRNTFDSNKIINSKAENGGGIYTQTVQLTLTNNRFENVSAKTGGAIYNNQGLKLSNNTLINSKADLGNDIYNAKNISVSYLTFIDNSTRYGIYLNNITVYATLTDDVGNTITGQNVTFEINGKNYYAESIEGNASFNYTIDFDRGSKIVNGSYAGSILSDTVIKTGLITGNLAELDITKTVETKKYYVGDIAKYTIKLSNKDNFTVYDIIVKDFMPQGLEFIEGMVTKGSYVDKVWTIDKLNSNETVEFTYYCTLTKTGSINNTAIVNAENSLPNNSSALINVLPQNPDIEVVKKALNSVVILGDKAQFEIIVNNTGNMDLGNVTITEDSFDGLEYDNYVQSSLWNHSIVNGKYIWTLNEVLTPNRVVSLIVNFNTVNVGSFINNAIVKSNKTDEELVNALVDVIRPEIKVEKICLTPNVVLGNQAKFEIIVNNTGSVDLSNVSVIEYSFEGLVFDSFTASSRLTFSNIDDIPTWTFNEELPAGEWISLIVNFNTTTNGTFTNYVGVASNMSEGNAESTVNVLKPQMTVEKVTLTPKVILGDISKYEIIVHNNGQTDLTDVVVEELPDASLVYDHYRDNGLFNHSIVNGVHTWTLSKLNHGAYAGFIVYYKTTAIGNVSNAISVKSKEIDEIDVVSNVTNVLMPSLDVKKIALQPYVLINNQTLFEIVVRNTGEVVLHDVFIIEDDYEGLIYDGAVGDAIWTHELVSGKHKWTLNEALQANEFIALFLRFNTTELGNLTNVVIAGSLETGNKTANATVEVFEEDVPQPPISDPDEIVSYELFKTVISEQIIVGKQVTFQVVIHNTGEKDIQKIVLTELPPESLIYDSFVDYIDLWTYEGDLTWSSKRPLYAGEYNGFFITFNTTDEGTFTNSIGAVANNGNVTFANVSFDVLKPDFTIEKVLVENNIVNGSKAVFEIVIHNTGKTSLNNLIVKEDSFEGLIYDSFIDYLDLWTYNGDLTWTMKEALAPGEYVVFFVLFNTTDIGNFTNVVVANSSECENKYSNAVVSVLNQDFDISMICLNPVTILGNQVTFEITVQNTGKLDLSSLKISEVSFNGLVFDHFNDYLGHWIYNGDLTWTLNETLVSREVTSLFVVFNTTDVGNFTNVVLAEIFDKDANEILSADGDVNSNAKFANATVEVIKPEYIIDKVAINRTVNAGEQVVFEIIVKNTGMVNIDGIVISENPDEGLIFDHFIDTMDLWIKDGMNWILNTTLLPQEVVPLYVVFNTTQTGNFTNVIESENLTANATVEVKEVIKPVNANISITTHPLTPVYIGNDSTIIINVTNTGDVNLTDVFVQISFNEGLKYYNMLSNFWYRDNNSRIIYNGTLNVGETSSFVVVVHTLELGNLSSIAFAGFDNALKVNSTFVIEVLNVTVPVDNETDPVPGDKNNTPGGNEDVPVPEGNNTPTDNNDVLISDNTSDVNADKSIDVSDKTGNPLVLILLSLLTIVSVNRRRKN